MMPHTSLICFLASYLVAFALEMVPIRRGGSWGRWLGWGFAAAGLLAQTWYLLNRGREANLPPLLASTHDWMLVVAWLVMLGYLLWAVWNSRLNLGVFVYPLVLVLIGVAHKLDQVPNTELYVAQARRNWGLLHASLLVFGVVAAAAGCFSALMYLLQHRRLKTSHAERQGFQMPSLPRLAAANRWAFLLSFVLLTLGYASGLMLSFSAPSANSTVSLSEPIVILSGLVWLLLAGALGWLLAQRGSAGRQVAWLTMVGLGGVLLTIFGLQLVTGHLHRGGRTAARMGVETQVTP
jgi:ABC-type uncharacterized transport system permease subunit